MARLANSTDANASLQVANLSHNFGPEEVLVDINFSLNRGEVAAIVGPSGGGKTTLLHLCAGLLDVETGQISNPFKRHAFAFQEARLLMWKTCLDNIAFGLKAQGVSKKQRYQQATEMALRFGLSLQDLAKFPNELSGGMRQRVSFARAFVTKPDLLYLDEPFSALDIGLKQELMQQLKKEIIERQMSVLFITHDLMEAVRLSDHIHLLKNNPGRLVETFNISQPLNERDDRFVYAQTAKLLTTPSIINTFELSTHV